MIKVVKRDGRIKPFDFTRISEAIKKAYDEVNEGLENENQQEEVIDDIFNVVSSIKKECVSVEEIQDIIVDVLGRYNKKVSKAYSDYREERSSARNYKTDLIKGILGIVDNTNTAVLTENSNKQAELASTQRDLIAGEVSKYVSKTKLIPKHLMEAHYKGIIKIHDLDYFLQPTYNCELINMEDMLQNGTVINKKKIEKPKSLRTAMTLVTQISAQISSSTYGK